MSASRIEIRIGGTGGQGLILSAKMLADAMAASGKRVAQSQAYEPTSRGGFCNADLVIADGEVDFPLLTAIDHLVLLDRLAVQRSWPLLKPGALVIADTQALSGAAGRGVPQPPPAAQRYRVGAGQRARHQHRRARRFGGAERHLHPRTNRAGGAGGDAARLPRSQHGCVRRRIFAWPRRRNQRPI